MTGAAGPRKALALGIAANVCGLTAHTTYMYYLSPIALRAGGIVGKDAIAFSLVAVAMGLAVVPAGRLADRIPRRRVMRIGLLLLGLAYLALLAPPSLPAILAGVVSSGVGLAFLFVSFGSYVADLLAGSERSRAYGAAGAMGVLASALGPFCAAIVLRNAPVEGLRINTLLFALVGLLGIILTWQMPTARGASLPPERGSARATLRSAMPLMALYLLQGIGYGMTAPYFTVYFLDELGLANDTWGYILAAGTLASAAGSFFAGRLIATLPASRVMLGGQTALLLACGLFLFPLPTAALVVGFLGRSLFSTTTGPGVSTLIMERASPGRRAEAQSYTSVAWNAGWATGAGIGGAALATLGGASFAMGGAIGLAGVTTGVVLLHRSFRT